MALVVVEVADAISRLGGTVHDLEEVDVEPCELEAELEDVAQESEVADADGRSGGAAAWTVGGEIVDGLGDHLGRDGDEEVRAEAGRPPGELLLAMALLTVAECLEFAPNSSGGARRAKGRKAKLLI